ncbi:MAG: IS1595 family transposase [Planctomycetes bacterium]|nr:IS1595 family transposase [Planctomycetota bacterium]
MAQTYEMNLVKLIEKFRSEEKCRAYLETLRWPDGPVCPRCGCCEGISQIHDRGQFDCDSCRYQFSVTAGTMMHDTKLPLWKWFLAVYMIVESKKGISANQLKRTLNVAYRTAWYLCHRIRKALETPDGLLKGIIEIDGTYIGGEVHGKGTRYTENKKLVIGAVQRDGKIQLKATDPEDDSESTRTVGKFVRANIAKGAMVYTDGAAAYKTVLKDRNRHERVDHAKDEWVRGDVHTNSVEGVWSLFNRSIIGAFHQVSIKHLPAYLDEFEFRFNNRDNPYIFRDAMKELLTAGNVEYKDLVA